MTEKQEPQEMYSKNIFYAKHIVSLRVVSSGKLALEVSKYGETEYDSAYQPQVLIVTHDVLSTIRQLIEDFQSPDRKRT